MADYTPAGELPPLPDHTDAEQREVLQGMNPHWTMGCLYLALCDRERQLRAALAQRGECKTQWVSVDERWPEQWQRVLTWDGVDVEVTSKADALQAIWSNCNACITHWQPLPPPPVVATREKGEQEHG